MSTRWQGGSQEPKRETDPLSDGTLVQRASNGDTIAFSELVTRHYRRAVRVAYGLLKDPHDAEDVAQDAFARVYQRLHEFEGASAFYTWLYRIVVNLSIDLMRKRKRERRVDIEDESLRDSLAEGLELWPASDAATPETSFERQEISKKLQKAFDGLPEIHQSVVFLRELEGQSYDEIAETLKIKKGTVMSRLFHARKILQHKLSGAGLRPKVDLGE
jgi:RNA polymerase sigma-70 factor, ECF subfamily